MYFIPWSIFTNLKHQGFLDLDNPQDWIIPLFTEAFWWMVLSYLFFSSLSIFLKNVIPCCYCDSSLSEIKSLFYFLSVIASIMSHNICVLKKAFFFHYHTNILFTSSVSSFLLSIQKDAVTFKQMSVVLPWYPSVQMMTIHRFPPPFLTFQLITWLQSLMTVDYALKYLRNGQ